VTPEHPFMTRAGWKSAAPEATFAENNSFPVGALKVGDELVRLETVTTRAKPMVVAFGGTMQAPSVEVLVETKFSLLESMVPQDGDPFTTVYNLRLDGNHTYFANSYLVHNK
jgi:intein/homing endonuclease